MKKRYIIALFSFLIFLTITILVLTNNTISFDNKIYNFLIKLRSPFFDTFFKGITEFANPIPVIIILALFGIFLKRNDEILLSTNVLVTLLMNQVLKHIIQRPRPSHLRLIKEGGYSYPSGHSMIAACLYATLIYIILKRIDNKLLKGVLIILLTILIVLIGCSRIYVGVHYPSDVLGGYFLTLSIIIVTSTIANNYLRGKKKYDKDGSK